MIIDKRRVFFRSGSGGEGSSSLTNLSSRKIIGGGGDGGKGGDVVLCVDPHFYDLSRISNNKKYQAQKGDYGRGKNKKGRDASDLIVGLPLGTRVFYKGKIIIDLIDPSERFLVCRGGAGGKGNYRKDYVLPAKQGLEKEVILDYRIPNEAALIGFPNSGKTTLLNALTGKNQKVAQYPFTTLTCFWAPFEYKFKKITVLDTPPLKKRKTPDLQANYSFLRHILRSKILIFVCDDPLRIEDDIAGLKKEISFFDPKLLKDKMILPVLTKADKSEKAMNFNSDQDIELIKKKISDIL